MSRALDSHGRRLATMGMAALLALALAPATTVAGAGPLQAADSIRGRVLDPGGGPLDGLEVVLHRVTDAGGASVAWDTTVAGGAFHLAAPDPAGPEALYFVAVRYEGDLYIADPFPGTALPDSLITLQVGVPGTAAMSAASAANTLPASSGTVQVRPPVSWRRWGIALVVGLSLVGFLAYLVLRRGGAPERNRLLLDVASLEEELASGSAGGDPAELRRAHAEALARLRAVPPR